MTLFILNIVAYAMIFGSVSTIAAELYIRWIPIIEWRLAYANAEKAYENRHLRG